jgi:plasmid stability protein
MMATINLCLPEDLLAGLEAKAAAEGKSVEQLAEEALRASLKVPSWEDLLAYGLENGRRSGYTEDDVPRLVKEFRREQRGR